MALPNKSQFKNPQVQKSPQYKNLHSTKISTVQKSPQYKTPQNNSFWKNVFIDVEVTNLGHLT